MTDRNRIGEIIVRDLVAAEETSSAAIAAHAQLTLTLIESRRAADVSATVGLPILQKVHQAHGAHLEGLKATAQAHKLAQELARRMNVTAGTPQPKDDQDSVWGPGAGTAQMPEHEPV